MKNEIEESYGDRSKAMTDEARLAFRQELSDGFTEFKSHVAIGQKAVVLAVNRARSMGATIQSYTGHEKLLPAEFNQLSLSIPDASFNFARECLSIHHANPKPVSDYAEAKPMWDRLMVQMEMLKQSKREKAQAAPPPVEPIEQFLHNVGALASEYAKMEVTTPIESWKPFYRQTFLNESARIVAIRDRVLKMV